MDQEFKKSRKGQSGEAVIFIVFAFAFGVWLAGQIRLHQEMNVPKITVAESASVANSGNHAR
jgi:hypothetical protein